MNTLDEQYDRMCECLRHDDTNIHNRTNWALIFHGLLFSAFVGAIGLLEKLEFKAWGFNAIAIGIILTCVLGIVSSILAFMGVRAAEVQLREITTWWERTCPIEHVEKYPPHYSYVGKIRWLGTSTAFLLLAVVWGALLCLVWGSERLQPASSEPAIMSCSLTEEAVRQSGADADTAGSSTRQEVVTRRRCVLPGK